ncbi:vacuolar protein-sorting-associated protein 36 [Abrus precatorius]|uniref:Vacuolar protein-sorting-associated protein 36 n=1 Tax=Abrus precatorius TaxID=3816 RepID=A0A8B8LL20_ABRPR|nr:vacuolar protein-sorting-associated protein 36 [Abrus precatorius]
MELDNLSKIEEEPPLSGAYIRSLVKQLTTSRTKDIIMSPTNKDSVVKGGVSHGQNLTKHGKVVGAHQAHQSMQPQQHKKQVRRRLHTTRPYQERLLNMAEARREIVTALKFHRAAMKEASEQKQQQQRQHQEQQQAQEQQQRHSASLQPSQYPSFEQDGKFKSRRNPRIYPACTNNFSSYMDELSYSCLSQPPPAVPNSYTWPSASPIPPPPLMAENPDFLLPKQTLGLNLNIHDFDNLGATLHLNNSSSSSYSSATSSSPQEVPSVVISQGEGLSSLGDTIESNAQTKVTGGLHTAMDDEGMAEIRSLGEQYQMEWNDTMNLVKSACWFKFLKNMEHKAPEAKTEDDAYHNFDQLLEFPAWLNANESCLEQCSEDYFQDSTLPCMDIGDIDGMDDDWLA